jgi:hypothetical protein
MRPHLTERELAGHGFVTGGPGSGKTTFLQLLVEASAGRIPVVVVDPKGSPCVRTVASSGHWTEKCRPICSTHDPGSSLARHWLELGTLEAEDYSADARVYRDAAHQRALWAAWALALRHEPMDLARLRTLLDRGELLSALEPCRWRDSRVEEWFERLAHQHGGIEDSGARGLDRALGTLLDGVALRGSLRHCPEAFSLDDVMASSWCCSSWTPRSTRTPPGRSPPGCCLAWAGSCEIGRKLPIRPVRCCWSTRLAPGLERQAAGLAVVLATQGPSDLEAVDRALLAQVLQETAW